MKTRFLFVALLTALILIACGPKATPRGSFEPVGAPATMPPAVEQAAKNGGAPAEQPAAQDAKAAPDNTTYNTGATTDTNTYDRMVIKNGEITLLVKDSDVAIDGITQLVSDVSGYIVSSQFWYEAYYEKNYKYATITISIPADQFETALRRLRNLSINVLNETASGQDVTDQYVDLQSQLTNLEATRDRIKSFLDQAKTVDEALKINQQLSDIEAQIEKVKGQINYLSNRSAFSTITITVKPDLPVIVATPTPSPTPSPTATPIAWKPGETAKKSWNTLTFAYRGIIDFLIWFFTVPVLILAPWVLLGWLAWRFLRRKPKA
jgi:hypothetical protein